MLDEAELNACHEHEVAHLRGKHSILIRITNLANNVLGYFAVTKAMASEVSLLLELVADAKVTNRAQLKAALRKLSVSGREIAIRLGE